LGRRGGGVKRAKRVPYFALALAGALSTAALLDWTGLMGVWLGFS